MAGKSPRCLRRGRRGTSARPNSRIVRLDWVRRPGMSVFFGPSSGKNDGIADAMTAEAPQNAESGIVGLIVSAKSYLGQAYSVIWTTRLASHARRISAITSMCIAASNLVLPIRSLT